MTTCKQCKKESNGYKYCKECYDLIIVELLKMTICKQCKKESNGYKYCKECYDIIKDPYANKTELDMLKIIAGLLEGKKD